ncbi:hypothetical protein DPV73_07365 [Leptospira mayottensis]|nr:hypothetical protein DPV73_07365 [Leptospira mayottensis]
MRSGFLSFVSICKDFKLRGNSRILPEWFYRIRSPEIDSKNKLRNKNSARLHFSVQILFYVSKM